MPLNKIKKSQTKKAIAIFLLLTLLNQALLPTITYALTAGPTAPEATNFEPIDTTDMVNPLTGGFTYNMPLLEVPGPEGSYPLSLSYHAGIQPNEEASWVGLGWTLNPGAIARNVNGYPDDWNGGSGTTSNDWNGGSTSSYSAGVSVGLGNTASVNAGLSFSEDTYRGFGVGADVGANAFGAGVKIGVAAYGGLYAGASYGYQSPSYAGLNAGASIGVQTNFKTTSAGFSGGISAGGESLLGASISTGNTKPSFSVGGGSSTSVNNANAGKMSSYSYSEGIFIPIGIVSISLGYSYMRYWSATTANFSANGVLYNRPDLTWGEWTDTDDDNYSIGDPINSPTNIDPLTIPGGTFPNFDDYSVTAQGLGGNMRPYLFSSLLYNQSRVNSNDHSHDVYDEKLPISNEPSNYGARQFRFVNDLSNSYRQQHPWISDQALAFDGNPQYGNNDAGYGYDVGTNRLEGTNHIEYFTNAQISNGTAALRGFITVPDEAGFIRANCPPTQIGGFMITNSSGVTYHYALPAYSSHELIHSETINSQPNGFSSTDLNKNTPYAYTWYLTAITGPDYISRGATAGLIDNSDWGYWVKFEYGQWANNYLWNTPAQGLTADIDGQFQTLSAGSKEIYYLDAIQTRTHTAIFEKELRADGKGATAAGPGGTPVGYPVQSYNPYTYNPGTGPCQGDVNSFHPTATLRLKEILLLQNDQLNISINSLRASSTNYNMSFAYNACLGPVTEVVHQGQNVIDSYDIAANSAIVNNCLRKIVFNHDYSLCPGVPNSYDPTGASTYIASPVTPTNFLGKLTLLSVDFQGKGGTPMTPPIQFQYDLDPTSPANQGNITITNAPANQQGTLTGATYAIFGDVTSSPPDIFQGLTYSVFINQTGLSTITVQTPNNFSIGDILSFQFNGSKYYCTLLSPTPGVSNGFNVLFLNSSPGTNSINTTVAAVKTKNPPYNYDAYDSWQCYKSDYVANPGNINLARFTTPVSNVSTDVWSLRKIISSVGANININYEGNTYNRSVLNQNAPIVVSSNQLNSDNTMDMIAPVPPGFNLSQFFSPGGVVTGPLAFYRVGTSNGFGNTITQGYDEIDLSSYPPATIVSVTGNDIKVQLDPTLAYYLKNNMISNIPVSSVSTIMLVSGNLFPNVTSNMNYGGGIRVKNVTVDDLNGNVQQTAYTYCALGSPGSTSGVTSFLPVINQDNLANGMNNIYENVSNPLSGSKYKLSGNDYSNFYQWYQGVLNKRYASYLLAVSRVVPSPGVMYETVAVNNNSILPNGTAVPVGGKTVYQYEVFKPEMVGLEQYEYEAPNTVTAHSSVSGSGYTIANQSAHDVSIKDYTSRVGNLKRVVTYDNQGNILTEKINHYLYDDLDNTSFQNQVNNYEPRLATFNYSSLYNNYSSISNYNGVSYNDMGVILERYGTSRASVDPGHVTGTFSSLQYDEMLVMSNLETFPAIQTGTTQIDYKNGTSMSQTNLAFDFYTGAVTQTLTTDSYGNRFISVATPAYMAGYTNGGISTLTYPALGLRTHDDDPGAVQHKQMLSQQASNYTFSVDANNNPIGVVTATVQTWSNSAPVSDPTDNLVTDGSQSNIWRMEKNFTWMPTGTSSNNVQPYSTFADYYGTTNGGNANSAWKKTSQVTQYNVYSSALEAADINNNYAATRMGYNNSKVLITGGVARYNEIAYTGAEDVLLTNGNFSTQISPGGGTVVTDSTKAHTGVNSLMVAAGQNGFTYTVPISALNPVTKGYSVSVWVKPPTTGGTVNQANLYYQSGGNTVTPAQTYSKTANGCYLLEMTVPASAIPASGNLVVGCNNGSAGTLYFDDFRFQPTSASTTAYVYDSQTGELTYILGNNNLFTRFQYDAIGRLVRTYKEVLGKATIPIIKAVSYNYGSYQGTNNSGSSGSYTYYNVATSQVFYSQNCGSGTAQPITYTVPASTYSSTVSQAAANTLAQNDINTNGQLYANTHGGCTVPFQLVNNAGISGYSIVFTNATTNVQSSFSIPTVGGTIQILPGTYNIQVEVTTGRYIWIVGSQASNPAPGCSFFNIPEAANSANASLIINTSN